MKGALAGATSAAVSGAIAGAGGQLLLGGSSCRRGRACSRRKTWGIWLLSGSKLLPAEAAGAGCCWDRSSRYHWGTCRGGQDRLLL